MQVLCRHRPPSDGGLSYVSRAVARRAGKRDAKFAVLLMLEIGSLAQSQRISASRAIQMRPSGTRMRAIIKAR
jgi:hypothetical protein